MLLIEECRPPLFSNRSSLRQSKTSLRWRRHIFLNRFKFGRNVNITLRLYYCNKLHSKTSLFITVTCIPYSSTMFPFEPAAMYNIALRYRDNLNGFWNTPRKFSMSNASHFQDLKVYFFLNLDLNRQKNGWFSKSSSSGVVIWYYYLYTLFQLLYSNSFQPI